MEKMNEDFEISDKSQLQTLKSQIETIKNQLENYEERNRKLKKIISEELIDNLITRFEKNEERIRKIDEKLDSIHFKINEKIEQDIRNIKQDLSEAQLSKSISRILDEKEIKIDSKPLEKLKKNYIDF